ncbi:MAG: Holliday junction branch migration protein RuvA [Deltaproteobacteria bacterium]|nr:Holliday junction branch migration protein RuvA [Deltaproteobacteria bacterium]
MISWLEGTLREKHPDRLLLDVRGVGYELLISLATFGGLPDVGKTLSIYARTVAREDALLLYGFGTARERDIFELLLRANRIGPKLAQTILSGIDPERVVHGLREGDVKLLCSAPGVGKKMAERMVVELREKAAELGSDPRGGIGLPPQSEPETGADLETRGQALSALLNLGYSRAQAERVVEAAAREAGEGASIEGLIRNALRRLAR